MRRLGWCAAWIVACLAGAHLLIDDPRPWVPWLLAAGPALLCTPAALLAWAEIANRRRFGRQPCWCGLLDCPHLDHGDGTVTPPR